MKEYKVISFDIFQTLVDVNQRIPDIWKAVFPVEYTEESGRIGAVSVLKHIGPLYEEACRKFIPMQEFYTIVGEKVVKETGFHIQAKDISYWLMKNHGLAPYFEHVPEVVKELKQKYQVILSSDASHMMADPVIEKVKPDAVFISDDLGCYKGTPEGAFFQKVLQKLSIKPQEILHIGDGVGDIRGAYLCGIDSCLVNRSKKQWTQDYQPSYQISDFSELRKIL